MLQTLPYHVFDRQSSIEILFYFCYTESAAFTLTPVWQFRLICKITGKLQAVKIQETIVIPFWVSINIKKVDDDEMKSQNKRDLILDALQELMSDSSPQAISVSEIAQKAGIGKGSIYYYFPSKNDMLEAVIERSYSRVLDEGQALAAARDIGAVRKMELIYQACLDSSLELKRQVALTTFHEQQQSALIHQKFMGLLISRLEPILADIIKQGIQEGTFCCRHPKETARIILTVLTVTLDNSLSPTGNKEIEGILEALKDILEKSLKVPKDMLLFLMESRLKGASC